MEQENNKVLENNTMEQQPIKKRGRQPKTDKTHIINKEVVEATEQPKPKTETSNKDVENKAEPKARTRKQNKETEANNKDVEDKPKPTRKPRTIKLQSEEEELFKAELALRRMREAEKNYNEAIKGLVNKPKPPKNI